MRDLTYDECMFLAVAADARVDLLEDYAESGTGEPLAKMSLREEMNMGKRLANELMEMAKEVKGGNNG